MTTLVLLGVLFIMVNWISSRRYTRWDFTRQKMSKLSDQTIQALKTLEAPVTVTVFYQPNHRLSEFVRDLLEEYQRVGRQLKVEYVDPDQDIARARQLVQQFQIENLNVVIFQSGTRHKYLSDTELAEYDYSTLALRGQPRMKAFKGEDAFTSAIISVTQAESPLIWFTSGHGEKSVEEEGPTGLSELKRYLEQQNLLVEQANLLEHPEIPKDVRLIAIAGPTRRFIERELSLLETYLNEGGRLLTMIDPLDEAGLEPLLERWGVTLGQDIVVDPAQQLPFVSAANLFITTYTQHPIVEKMKTLMTLFPLARSVSPSEPTPEGITAVALAMTSRRGWGETNTGDSTFTFATGEDLEGPVAIAVAAERPDPTPARLVVFGDSDFIANGQLNNVGNRDILLGASYWLIEQEQLIGISPKPLELIKLNLTARQLMGMFWFSLLAMPLLCGILGTTTWWIRRK